MTIISGYVSIAVLEDESSEETNLTKPIQQVNYYIYKKKTPLILITSQNTALNKQNLRNI